MSHLERSRPQTMRFNPVGDTDSELLFCLLLEHLLASFPEGSPPDHHSMHNIVLRFWLDLCEPSGTICNFLLSDGTCLLAGCWPGKRPSSDVWNSLFYCVRKYPFTYATLSDCDHKINFSDVAGPDDRYGVDSGSASSSVRASASGLNPSPLFLSVPLRVAVIATEKLTSDEEWFEIPKGKLIVFLQGMPLLTDEHILLGRTESARRDPTKIIATAQSESALL
jgi:predicted glutamine amidotransferase